MRPATPFLLCILWTLAAPATSATAESRSSAAADLRKGAPAINTSSAPANARKMRLPARTATLAGATPRRKRPPAIASHALVTPAVATTNRSYSPVGDFTGNGATDIFGVTRSGARWLWQISESGRAPFKTINSQPVNANALRFADFNGDGKVDVFHLATSGEWSVAFTGRGPLRPVGKLQGRIDSIGFGDVNADGHSDLLQIDASGNWRALYSGKGRWQTLGRYGGRMAEIALADFDGDSRTDALRIDSNGNWLLLNFKLRKWVRINRLSGRLTTMHIADIDGDGKADVISKDKDRWRYAAGAKGAWRPLVGSAVAAPRTHTGDFDGDGKADLFYVAISGRSERWLYQNDFRARPAVLRIDSSEGPATPAAPEPSNDPEAAETVDPNDPPPAGNPGGQSTPSVTTPVFLPGLRLTEAPGRCYLESRHINSCVLSSGRSAVAVAGKINALQAHSTLNCCAALERLERTTSGAGCTLLRHGLRTQLGCATP